MALTDVDEPGRTQAQRTVFDGSVWSVRTDRVDLGEPGVVERDVIDHPGAVAVAALDEAGCLVVVRQYRHPVRARLWELPAGLLDVPGEPLVVAAQRELSEEAGLAAATWSTLIDLYPSPGGSSERIRVFLAEGLKASHQQAGYRATGEELGLEVARYPLAEVVDAALAGHLHNAALVAAVLALRAVLDGRRDALRPADAEWGSGPDA